MHLLPLVAVGSLLACGGTQNKSAGKAVADPSSTETGTTAKTLDDTTETTRLQANCEALEPSWRAEFVEPGVPLAPDEQAALDERIARFECKIELDLDGDGALDTAFPISDAKGKVGIGVRLGNGGALQLGGGEKTEVSPTDTSEEDKRTDDNYDWIVAWKTVAMADGKFQFRVLGNLNETAAPDALGDGLQLSGGDAAAIFYLAADGWRWLHLGF